MSKTDCVYSIIDYTTLLYYYQIIIILNLPWTSSPAEKTQQNI